MNTENSPVDIRVKCEVCLKEIPPSEAKNSEAIDYVVYFCGVECYDEWKHLWEEELEKQTD